MTKNIKRSNFENGGTDAGRFLCLTFLFVVILCCFPAQGQVQPANSFASQDVRKLLTYVTYLPQRDSSRVISGQFLGYAFQVVGGSGYDKEIKALQTKTEKWVALLSTDFAFTGDPYKKYCSLLADYWDAGHLIYLSYHIPKPAKAISALPTDSAWKAQLDSIAMRLKYLSDRKVVVFWRPFHEMNGTWFWYGTQSRTDAEFKALWQHMFNYLTNKKKLNNLIWVYSPDDGPGKVTIGAKQI
jgi:mannan endo-1,4-beta-mannosidase